MTTYDYIENHLDEQDLFETKLALLQEITDKKHAALTAILGISENQEQLYLSPPSDQRREFLLEMGKLKQIEIDEVIACDAVFQQIFDEIADVFEEKCKLHADKGRKLQDSVREVLELDVKIRAQEQKSQSQAKESLGLGLTAQTKENAINPANTNYILNQYKNNSKPKPK